MKLNGLLAVGGDLSPERLLAAYRAGVFPWPLGEVDDPMFWFSPDPRFVLRPGELHVGRSLRKTLRAGRFRGRPTPGRGIRMDSISGMNRGESPCWPGEVGRVIGRQRRSATR